MNAKKKWIPTTTVAANKKATINKKLIQLWKYGSKYENGVNSRINTDISMWSLSPFSFLALIFFYRRSSRHRITKSEYKIRCRVTKIQNAQSLRNFGMNWNTEQWMQTPDKINGIKRNQISFPFHFICFHFSYFAGHIILRIRWKMKPSTDLFSIERRKWMSLILFKEKSEQKENTIFSMIEEVAFPKECEQV